MTPQTFIGWLIGTSIVAAILLFKGMRQNDGFDIGFSFGLVGAMIGAIISRWVL